MTHGKPQEIAAGLADGGYYHAIPALQPGRALDCLRGLLARRLASDALASGAAPALKVGSNPHASCESVYRVATSPPLLDAVEAVIGRDIMIWASTFFIKAPLSSQVIPWHQDLRYADLTGDDYVTAWVALSASTRARRSTRTRRAN